MNDYQKIASLIDGGLGGTWTYLNTSDQPFEHSRLKALEYLHNAREAYKQALKLAQGLEDTPETRKAHIQLDRAVRTIPRIGRLDGERVLELDPEIFGVYRKVVDDFYNQYSAELENVRFEMRAVGALSQSVGSSHIKEVLITGYTAPEAIRLLQEATGKSESACKKIVYVALGDVPSPKRMSRTDYDKLVEKIHSQR